MQSALFFRLLPPPASGAGMFAWFNSAGTRRTAYADKALVMELIERNIVLVQVAQHVFIGPVDQRVVLVQATGFTPFQYFQGLPVLRLLCAQAGDPYFYTLQRPV